MRAAPDRGRGARAAAREGSLLIILHPKRAAFSPSPEDTSAAQLVQFLIMWFLLLVFITTISII